MPPARLTRRGFLAATAVLAAGCGGSPDRRRRRVVVVGAGIAGLSAADALRKAGVDVVVLEAEQRVGGRMLTLRDFAGDQVAEGGGEFIDAGHTVMRGFAKRFGLPLDDLYAVGSDRPGCFYFDDRRTANHYVYGNAEDRFYDLVDDAGRPDASAGQVIDGMRLSPGARMWLRHSTIRDDFTVEPEQLSSLFVANSESDSGGGPLRYHVRGGNDQIPRALAERLGTRVHLGAAVTAIAQDPGGVVVTAGGETFRGDGCIVAAPLPALRDVTFSPALPKPLAAAIAGLQYGTAAKVAIQYRRRHWRTQGYSGDTLTDLPISTCWEATDGQPGAAGILLVYTAGAPGEVSVALTDDERIARAVADLARIYPDGGEPIAAQTQAWPHTYTAYAPGQFSAYARALRKPVGRIVLAGEHVADVTAYMEGAARSGLRAARMV